MSIRKEGDRFQPRSAEEIIGEAVSGFGKANKDFLTDLPSKTDQPVSPPRDSGQGSSVATATHSGESSKPLPAVSPRSLTRERVLGFAGITAPFAIFATPVAYGMYRWLHDKPQSDSGSTKPIVTPEPEKPAPAPTATFVSVERSPFASALVEIDTMKGPKFNIRLQKDRELAQSTLGVQKDSEVYGILNEWLPRAKIDQVDIALLGYIPKKPGEEYRGIDVSRVPVVRTQTIELNGQEDKVTLDFRVFRTANNFQIFASVYPDSNQPNGMSLSPVYFKPGAYKPEEVDIVSRALSANIVRLVIEQARGIGTYTESYLKSIEEQASGVGGKRPFVDILASDLQVKIAKPS